MGSPNTKKNFSNLDVWILIAIILYAFALYFIPLQSKAFYFDDRNSIENNEAIKAIDIPKIFDAFNTRFLVGLSFAFNYQLCALHPAGYRLINLLIHCLNAFLVYLLIKSTLYLYAARKSIFFCRLEWPAFFASMLFLCHPIQTEPVNFITQRFVLMGSFFYLLTLYLYIQYRCRSKKRYLIAGMGAAIAAMFCKEFVVTLPLMLVLYDFYFLSALATTWWKRCSLIAPFFIIVLIVPLLLMRTPPEAIRVANIADSNFIQEGDSQRVSHHIDITRAHGGIGRKQYFLTELNVVCTYVRLLFLPINQNFDYDYPISRVMDGKTLISGVFLLCLLALARVTYRSYRIISFSILWFFIALSVESSFIPIGHVIAEYRLYLASVGFVFLITTLIYMRQVGVKKLNMIAAAILIGLSILTYQRNKVWKDELALWNDTIQKSPHKARPYNNRGSAYYNQGDFTQAMSDFNKAIEINPGYADAYYNRGLIYNKQHNLIQAMSAYNKTIEINPNYAEAYANRAVIYYKQDKFTQALSDYNRAISIDPKLAEAYANRGVVYFKQGKFTQALSDYNRAIAIDPHFADTYNSRGFAYFQRGNLVRAMSDYNKAIEINPNYVEAYVNRGLLYFNQNNFTQAISDYSKTIEIKPELAEAYNDRGNVYLKQGNFTKAISDYNKAVGLKADFADAYYNLGVICYKQSNFTQAIFNYSKTIEINPNYAEAYNNRGGTYFMQGKYDQAISDYTKAIGINPNYAEAYNNRGNSYDDKGSLSQAIADYAKAIGINPNYAEAYDNRGIDYCNEGKLSQAVSDFTKAIEINSKFSEAYNNRGFAYSKEKEYGKAWADVNKAKELNYVVSPDLINEIKQALDKNK